MRRPSPAPGPSVRSPRWGRGLLLLGVAALCVVPAANAAASGHQGGAVQQVSSTGSDADHRTARPGLTSSTRAPRPERSPARSEEPRRTRTASPAPTSGPTSTPTRTAKPGGDQAPDNGTWWPWGRALHGLLTMPGDGGTVTTQVLQQGAVSALTADTVTVTSTDGFVAVWTLDDHTTLVGARKPEHKPGHGPSVDPSASPSGTSELTTGLAVGQQVGVWGTGPADAGTARFVVIHRTAPGSR